MSTVTSESRRRRSRRSLCPLLFCGLLAALLLLSSTAQRPTRAGAPQTSDIFADITKTSGLGGFLQHGGGAEKNYIIETTGSGVALIDFDNDGWLDVYFVNGGDLEILKGKKSSAKNKLYRNNGNGTFSDVTDRAGVAGNGSWGQGVCVGDYNNDGWDDLYVTDFGSNILYRNNGDRTFTDVTQKAGVNDPRWSTGCAFGDYDSDGHLDLFIANYVELDITTLPAPGSLSGTLGKYRGFCQYRGIPVMCGPRGLKGAGDSLYHNNGDGTFTDVTRKAGVDDPKGYYGFAVVWGDYDNDGDLDLFVANDSTPNFLYRNNGNGTFTDVGYPAGVAVNEQGQEQACMGVAWGDYNHDGWMDIYVTNFSDDSNTLYRNDGGGNFTDVTFPSGHGETTIPYLGWATGFTDFDNDGDLDVFVVNGHVYPQVDRHDFGTSYRQRRLLFENLGTGKFREIGRQSGPAMLEQRPGRGAAFGDINNDGRMDVVIVNMDEAPTVLRNDVGNRNNWLMIKLIGTTSNRSAIGARVRIKAGQKWQTFEVQSGGSYLSQNDLRAHFGIGPATAVDEIDIRWPSGGRSSFRDIKANRLLTIREDKGIVDDKPAKG